MAESQETDIKRKLATIVVADIVGFSRLTANDEDWTIRALGDFRKIVDDIIARHDGRIFNTGGDSVLAEFASPVEAVRAAVDFQEAARSRNLLQPRDRQLRYRIGINLGDVMVRGDDLLGDGVNVAARLEGIAEPGGICVSASVWDQINGKLSIGYVDIGEQSVKNIPRPVRAYHLRVDGTVGEAAAPHGTMPRAPPSAKKPPMAAILAGAAVIIVALAGALAWQMWPKTGSSPAAAVMPPPAPAAPAVPAPSLRSSLLASLASAAPTLGEKSREAAVDQYIAAPLHKAEAASQATGTNAGAWDRPTRQGAVDSALEACQLSSGQPCVLVAVDDAAEPTPSDGKWPTRDMPRIRYSGDFDPEQIPAAWAAFRARADIVEYRAAATPKAAAIHVLPSSLFIVAGAASQREAEDQALKACNDDPQRNGKGGPCFLYAVENHVVLALRLREPLTTARSPTTATAAPEPTPSPTAAALPPPVAAASPAPAQTAAGGSSKTFRDCPDCPEMVVIPAGSFQMGATSDENERFRVPTAEAGRDQPRHQVNFAKAFALAKLDITRAEFAAFAKATNFHPVAGCMTFANDNWLPQAQATWEEPGFAQGDQDPVVCMNQIAIQAYLGWLAKTTGKPYRLPSEAEWEYAERAGTTTAFYWGDDAKEACAYENVGDETLGEKYGVNGTIACRDGFSDLAPVGSFKPNPFGLYDMAGNITVQIADCWNESYAGAPADGSAWISGDCTRRVLRKGGFGNSHSWVFRSAHRQAELAMAKRNRVGFRVALSLP